MELSTRTFLSLFCEDILFLIVLELTAKPTETIYRVTKTDQADKLDI